MTQTLGGVMRKLKGANMQSRILKKESFFNKYLLWFWEVNQKKKKCLKTKKRIGGRDKGEYMSQLC